MHVGGGRWGPGCMTQSGRRVPTGAKVRSHSYMIAALSAWLDVGDRLLPWRRLHKSRLWIRTTRLLPAWRGQKSNTDSLWLARAERPYPTAAAAVEEVVADV
eukprot:scpid39028/ scgid18293/ 